MFKLKTRIKQNLPAVPGPKGTSSLTTKTFIFCIQSRAKRAMATAWSFLGSGKPVTATKKRMMRQLHKLDELRPATPHRYLLTVTITNSLDFENAPFAGNGIVGMVQRLQQLEHLSGLTFRTPRCETNQISK